METRQIVILAILAIAYSWAWLTTVNSNKKNNIETANMAQLLLFGMLFIVAVTAVMEMNRLKKDEKCPKYEKIENVYRLKS